jgi:Trk-type K+ transport system membrane component
MKNLKNWVRENLKGIIATSFTIPILLVAFVSISHVTTFYGLTNPFSWAIYLSVAIEIAALGALAGISANMGRFVYVPFLIVTFIQFVGNVFFCLFIY